MNLTPQSEKKDFLNITLSYVLAAITGAIGLFNWILLREVVLILIGYFSVSVWSVPAIDNFSFLLFGIIWLIVVLFSQYFYLKGLRTKKVWRNFSLITSIQLLLLVISQLLPIIVGVMEFDLESLILIGSELVVGLSMFIYVIKSKSKKVQNKINVGR